MIRGRRSSRIQLKPSLAHSTAAWIGLHRGGEGRGRGGGGEGRRGESEGMEEEGGSLERKGMHTIIPFHS